MDGHAMYRRKTVVVSKVKYNNVEYQRGMGGFYLMLWPKVEWN